MEKSGKSAFYERESCPSGDAPPTSAVKEKETGDKAESLARNKKNHSETRRERTEKQLLTEFLTELLLIGLAVWATLNFVVCVSIHYGNNMFPSVRDGDLVVTLRPQRLFLNAVTLYEHEGKLRLGRVVGMPGHVIDISEDGTLTVNGIVPAEEIFYPTVPSANGEISYPYVVREGEVFVLNDFRLDTTDSRIFGGVDLKDVKGPMLLSMRRRGF